MFALHGAHAHLVMLSCHETASSVSPEGLQHSPLVCPTKDYDRTTFACSGIVNRFCAQVVSQLITCLGISMCEIGVPDTLLGEVIPACSHLRPQSVVLILHLLVVLDALVDVVLPGQGRHLLLQLSLPTQNRLQLHSSLLAYRLCLP